MKRFAYIIVLLLFVLNVSAQEESIEIQEVIVEEAVVEEPPMQKTLVQDVNIVRDFVPTIKDAGKINLLPRIESTATIEKSSAIYSTWTAPMATRFDLQTLPSATLKRMRHQQNMREGYAKIGGGYPATFLGDFYVPVLKGKDYRFDFLANHLSTFGKVKLDDDSKVKAENMLNMGQLAFTKNFFNADLTSEVKFARRDFNYYGLNEIDFYRLDPFTPANFPRLEKDAHNMLDVNIGFASRPKAKGLNYGVSAGYELTGTKSGVMEHHIATEGFVTANWDIDEVGAYISLDNLFYNNPEPTNLLFNNIVDEFDSYSVLAFNPFYKFRRDAWNLKIGLKSFFSFNKGKPVSITPDVLGELAIVNEIFYLYGGVTGDYAVNSMRDIFNENQYFRPDAHVPQTYTPIDAYIGTKFKVFDAMVFNAFVGYKYINNQYFFVNHRPAYLVESAVIADVLCDNTFIAVTDKADVFNVGASITYNSRAWNVFLKGIYNNWNVKNQEYAWHKPNWQVNANIGYKINNDIKISANMLAMGKRYARTFDMNEPVAVELKPIFDLSLSGTYEYTSWVSFFLNLNNVFAQNYQIWYGYNSHRFNAMAGATFSF